MTIESAVAPYLAKLRAAITEARGEPPQSVSLWFYETQVTAYVELGNYKSISGWGATVDDAIAHIASRTERVTTEADCYAYIGVVQ